MILKLTGLDGTNPYVAIVRWEAIAYLRLADPKATRPGTFIHFLDGKSPLWVKESGEKILSLLEEQHAVS